MYRFHAAANWSLFNTLLLLLVVVVVVVVVVGVLVVAYRRRKWGNSILIPEQL